MIAEYSQAIKDIDELVEFLQGLDIDPDYDAHLSNDYYNATNYYENYKNGDHNKLDDIGRSAFIGLHELYKMIWTVKDCKEFKVIVPHLKMFSESAIRINSFTPMLNPVTGKQDDSTNKLIETIVAMFCIFSCENVDLDDPVASSNGKNPDILFDYDGSRMAIACKTLRSDKPESIFDNIISAANQIERSDCDYGFIAINLMNILPHFIISDNVYDEFYTPLRLVTSDVLSIFTKIRNLNSERINEIFLNSKVKPTLILFAHSNTRIKSELGVVPVILKSTFVENILSKNDEEKDLLFINKLNDFIHNIK
ncbi:hypothetical protein [Acinetobacter higginsii]|uniref:hypothetical protein n=1 Tax=Acinetobacter higginsii TaxID=70347 RepID=UPI002675DD87|nr:hypothetical protein [Acinetobacter higginsii]MDO3663389.1 hypothetical protein [Acinetobacter higginsii]